MTKLPNYDDHFECYMEEDVLADDLYEGIAEEMDTEDEDDIYPMRDDRDDYTGLTKDEEWG